MHNTVLHIENLAVGYSHNKLVHEINASLSVGDFCVLFGANGTGKSTLIKTIRGIIPSLAGSISLSGKRVSAYSDKELATKIAVVTTDTGIATGLTVNDIISFGRIPYQKAFASSSREDLEIINKYSNLLDIGELLDKQFANLSDGQKQKVLICRALVQNTNMILLDEPTAHLDVENRIKTFQLLKKIAVEEHKIVLCTTHEIETGLKHADKVWMIDRNQNFLVEDASKFSKETIHGHLFQNLKDY